MKKEHEDLIKRAITAETKIKLYEQLLNKLNLNIELNNENNT